MRYIRHITLTTGNSRDSFAGEVSPDILAICRSLIEQLSQARQAVPGVPGYEITGARWRWSMVATVWHNDAPLVTLGVAVHSRDGAQLWRTLHKQAELPVETSIDSCPTEPWAAVLLHAELAFYPDTADWLVDFERCLAWAFYRLSQELH